MLHAGYKKSDHNAQNAEDGSGSAFALFLDVE